MHENMQLREPTPKEFELAVKEHLESLGRNLDAFEARHRESLGTGDESYEIDITARFRALEVDFLVLVECKKWKRRVEREDVQVLHDRMHSVGAQKSIMYATSGFQSGAVEYAQPRGIGLVQLVDGRTTYLTRSLGPKPILPPGFPVFAGWLITRSPDGCEERALVAPECVEYLSAMLFDV